MNVMMKVIILFFIFLQYVCSQNYEDVLGRLFKRSFRHGNLDYSDYNSMCDCGLPYHCPGATDYYDFPNDDSKVEVVYVDPDQLKNIYNFILNRKNPIFTTTNNNDGRINEVTTQQTLTSESSVENTEAQYKPTLPANEEQTTRIIEEQVDDDDELPAEDTQNSHWHGSNSEAKENQDEYENSATSYSSENSSTNSPIEEDGEQSENPEPDDYNYDDQIRDSEEDRLSVKKVEDYSTNQTDEEVPEDDNNSEPANVYSWIKN